MGHSSERLLEFEIQIDRPTTNLFLKIAVSFVYKGGIYGVVVHEDFCFAAEAERTIDRILLGMEARLHIDE